MIRTHPEFSPHILRHAPFCAALRRMWGIRRDLGTTAHQLLFFSSQKDKHQLAKDTFLLDKDCAFQYHKNTPIHAMMHQ